MANHFNINASFENYDTLRQSVRDHRDETGKTFVTKSSHLKKPEEDSAGLRYKAIDFRCQKSR